MQIKEIVLYGKNGKIRKLEFHLGATNIIVGDSTTGKSSLVDILEYCLGSDTCSVPEGPIRDTVEWYGVLLQMKKEQIFIARKNPIAGKNSSTKAYFEKGVNLSPPSKIQDENFTIDVIRKKLTSEIGISSELKLSISKNMNLPISVNFNHGSLFCFQYQSEIASKKILFHRQDEEWIPRTLTVTTPYFLGAIPENLMTLEFELIKTRRELFRLEQELKEYSSIQGEGISKAIGLIAEAKEYGLISPDTQLGDIKKNQKILQEASKAKINSIKTPENKQFFELQEKMRNLDKELSDLDEKIHDVKKAHEEITSYSTEMEFQKERLDSLNIFDITKKTSSTCPLCESKLEEEISQVNSIQNSIQNLAKSLEGIRKEKPNIQKYMNSLEDKRRKTIFNRDQILTQIDSILKIQQEEQNLRNIQMLKSEIIGKIKFWLESVDISDENSALKNTIKNKKQKIEEIEKILDDSLIERKTEKALSEISTLMTSWSKDLGLEHSEYPIKLDLKKLTLIIERDGSPISLRNTGSGKNWMGYHVIVHLALHQFFIKHSRPVPRFIIFDQPSQVYYPQDKTAKIKLSNDDEESLAKVFNLIFDTVENSKGQLQVIITEHAEPSDERFQSNILERWRNGEKLIPLDWIEQE